MKSATYDEDDVLKSPVAADPPNQQNAGGPPHQNNSVPASYVSMPEKPNPQPAYPLQPAGANYGAYPNQGPPNPQPPVNYNNQQPPNGEIGSLYPEQPTTVIPQAIS